MMWGSSPVLRGEDEPETFSCQLYFLPRELLFNVSWKKKKRKEVERRNNRWIKEEQRWVCSLNSGSWHNIYNFSVCECVCLSLPLASLSLHMHTQTFYSVEWAGTLLSMLRGVHLKGPDIYTSHWETHSRSQTASLGCFGGVIADWSHETCEVSFLSIHF